MNPITLTPAAAPASPAPTHGAAAATDEGGDKPTFANELQRATKPATPDKPARGAQKSETPAETARKAVARPTHAPDTAELKADPAADDEPLAADDTPVADAGTLMAGLLQPQRPAERSAPAAGTRGERVPTDAQPVEGAAARRGAAGPADAAADASKATRAEPDAALPRAAANDKPEQPAFVLPQAAPQLAAPAPRPEAAATGADLRVPQHVASPEFAPGLGAQVSLLVKDGVQEARLQLNPAEMGPITVQIQVDGSNAQVSFSAEHAFTRDRIEQALPVLAGALQESGLTLTGGGVFEQQPRQPQGDAAPSARGRGGSGRADDDGGGDIAPVAARAPRAARGAVDLYA